MLADYYKPQPQRQHSQMYRVTVTVCACGTRITYEYTHQEDARLSAWLEAQAKADVCDLIQAAPDGYDVLDKDGRMVATVRITQEVV